MRYKLPTGNENNVGVILALACGFATYWTVKTVWPAPDFNWDGAANFDLMLLLFVGYWVIFRIAGNIFQERRITAQCILAALIIALHAVLFLIRY